MGEYIDAHLARIVNDHLEDVLADLPRIGSLPMPNDLAEVKAETRACPVVVEEIITIAGLQKHLAEADSATPEIGITIFENGTQTLEVGTTKVVTSSLVWEPFQEQGVIDFHTHPDPTEPEHMRLPTIADINSSIILGQSTAIGSHDGLTHVPKLEVDISDHTGLTLWRGYVASRNLDEHSFNVYGPGKVYTEFIRDVIKPRFTAWDALNGETSLAGTIISQREL